MSVQSDLHELIQTMSKHEKRYFSLFAKSNKSSDVNYLALFEAFAELVEYDEKQLIGKFLKKSGSSNSGDDKTSLSLNQEMHYLYQVLLQAMRQYMQKSAIHIQVRNLTSDAIFLRDRGLYQQAEKRIAKAKILARQYHNNVALLELNRLERSLIWSLERPEESAIIDSLVSDKDVILEALGEEMEYEDLYARVSNLINLQNRFAGANDQVESIRKSIDMLFAKKAAKDLPAFAELRRYQIKALFAMAERKTDGSDDIFKQLLGWWEKGKGLKEEEFFRYQISLSKFVSFLFNSKQYEEMMKRIEEIHQKNVGTPNGEALMFRFTKTFELLYYLNSQNLDKALAMLPDIESGVAKYALPVKRKITMFYNIALVCFIHGDFEYCNTWLLRILAYSKSNTRKDLIRKAFLLRIIILIENDDAFEAVVAAAKKHFREDKSAPLKEKIELNLLNLIFDALTGPLLERRKLMDKLSKELTSLASSPLSNRLNELDEFQLWCKSRLEGKSMREIFMEPRP